MVKEIRFLILAGAALVAACEREATGQVVAVVNGDEITLQELNGELQSSNVPEGADRKALQQAALQRIIERRLLAQQARDEGMDKSPEFMLAQRQMEDGLLVQMLSKNATRGSEVPNQRAIDQFMKENPSVFSGRTVYQLDRIQFPMPENPEPLSALEDAHSMDAVAAKLDELGIKFNRGPAALDSAKLNPTVLQRILALPQGEPFILPEGNLATVAVITGQAAQPISGDQARPLAVQAMRNKKVNDALQERLKRAKAEAKIEYQDGFAPKAAATKSTDAK
jgi:peptidyl-prolyl cis-trans isomerase C